MTTLEILQLLNMAMRIAESAGLNYQKLAAMRAQAKAEGRELSASDLDRLAHDAQSAIDKL